MMAFGILCVSFVLLGYAERQRREMRALKKQVKNMSDIEQQIADDIAQIKTGVANWNATAAASLQAKIAEAVEAEKAKDEARLQAIHAELSGIATSIGGSQPVTPPATPDNPSPAPVSSPVAGTDPVQQSDQAAA